MRFVLERRAERSVAMAHRVAADRGRSDVSDGARVVRALREATRSTALEVYFLDPLTDPWSLQEIAVKATPLVMIAIGLSLCYLANVWNIGAEGQFVIGAIAGGWLAVETHGTDAG